jgi:ABC-type bacteriocin/lantibiotic exporter with double-glycine peptidase domain
VFLIIFLTDICIDYYTGKVIKELFKNLIESIFSYELKFFKDYSVEKTNELHQYMSSVENVFEKVTMILPKHCIFVVYYTYSLYNISYGILLFSLVINIANLLLTHKLHVEKFVHQEKKILADIATKNRLLDCIGNIEFIKTSTMEDTEADSINNRYNKYNYHKLQNRFKDNS